MIKKVYQQNLKDCGVACLLSIIKYYKGDNTFENIRYLTRCSNSGITALNLIEASKKLGFKAEGLKCNYEDLYNIKKPCICHISLKNGYNHYIVLYEVNSTNVLIFDPFLGIKKYKKDEFIELWKSNVVIELIPQRKLDVVKSKDYKIYKNIIIKNKYLYLLIIVISFLSLLFAIVSNTFFKTLIDGHNALNILFIFILIIIIKEITNYIKNRLIIKLEYNIDNYLETEVHNRLLLLPNCYFNSRSVGDIITKFNDLSYIKELLIEPIVILIDIFILLIISIILFNISVKLTFIFLIFCLLYLFILLIYNKKLNNSIRVKQETNEYKNSILQENISSIETIKNIDIINYRHNIFKEVFNIYLDSNKRFEKIYLFINLLKGLILFIGIDIILYFGIKDNILLSDLILFNSLLLYFIEPINDLSTIIPILKNGINANKRISDIYSIENKDYINIDNYNITINNLNYSYDNYKYILKNFNYKINYKDKILVIGKSGSGKSTLFKILNKSYKIDDNTIYIGNKDINLVDINKYITYISQNERLFNDTLYNNIVLNNKTDKLNEIMKLTKLDEVLKRRNIKLDTIIEENGSNLSLGERQKIIISRALIKNNPILILDEALSGIDKEEEYEIIKNILNKFSDKTIIYISHSKVCKNLFKKILNFDKRR